MRVPAAARVVEEIGLEGGDWGKFCGRESRGLLFREEGEWLGL